VRAANFGEALTAAGFNPFEHQLTTVLANYFKSGGTEDRLKELIDLAKKMSGDGHAGAALIKGPMLTAVARQTVEGARGQSEPAGMSPFGNASPPSSNRHHVSAREPTKSQRAATLTAAKAAAQTIMDTLKVDGRAIGDWTVAEARRASANKRRESFILREAVRVVANADPSAKLRDVVKIREMKRIHERAMELRNAA
jgi:hypothetical protein